MWMLRRRFLDRKQNVVLISVHVTCTPILWHDTDIMILQTINLVMLDSISKIAPIFQTVALSSVTGELPAVTVTAD